MPRTAGESIPKYRKHRGSGQAVVTICGQDYYLGPHGTKASRLEYDRIVTEWLAGGRRRPDAVGQRHSLTVVEIIAAYLRHAREHYVKNGKPSSEQALIVWAFKPLRSLYGRTPAIEFGPLALKAVRLKFIEMGHARSTVNHNIRRVVRMFRWAAAEELIPVSVPQSLSMVSGLRKGRSAARESSPVLPVDDAIIEKTIPFLPLVVGDMVMVQRLSGCRPDEVCTMRPCDIDQSGDVWIYVPQSHKCEHHGRQRTIAIGARGQGVLRKYLARGPEMFCFRPCDSELKRRASRNEARKTPLSCGNRPGTNRKARPKRAAGDRYDVRAYRRAIYRACASAGVEQWAPNRLRHTSATQVRRIFGLEAARTVLGHSSTDTSEIYAEQDLSKALEVARQIG